MGNKISLAVGCALLAAAPLAACASSGSTSSERYVKVDGSPSNVVAAAGSVWTLDTDSGDVLRIDPVTRDVVTTIETGLSSAGRLVAREGAIWVVGRYGSAIIDAATDAVTPTDATPGVAAGDAAYTVVDNKLVELDPVTGEQRTVIELPLENGSDVYFADDPMVADGDVLYLKYNGVISETLGRFDTTTGELTYLYPIGDYVSIAVAGDTVWLLENVRKLTGYDTTIGDPIGQPIRLHVDGDVARLDDGQTALVVAADGTMWAIDQPAQLLHRLDPATGAVLSTTTLKYRPSSLLVLDDQIWLNNTFDDRLTVIDRAGIEASSGS
jgi:streptogramin lyase